jgi:hypothetical protein
MKAEHETRMMISSSHSMLSLFARHGIIGAARRCEQVRASASRPHE